VNDEQIAVPLTSVHTQLRAAALEMALRHVAGTPNDPMPYAVSFYNFIIGENK
jgi:hypothetical protein